MRAVGVTPDEMAYSSAIAACARAEQWERALSLLSEMVAVGLSPNVVCYTNGEQA